MSLRVKYVIVEADESRLTEDQVEVLQCLCHPEALTLIRLLSHLSFWYCDIGDCGVGELGKRCIVDRFEHAPRSILKDRVASDAIEDED